MTNYFDKDSFDVLVAASQTDGMNWIDKHLLYKGKLHLVVVDGGGMDGRIVRMIHATDVAYRQPGVGALLEALQRSARTSAQRFMEAEVATLEKVADPQSKLGYFQPGDIVRVIRVAHSYTPRMKVGDLGTVVQFVDGSRIVVELSSLNDQGPLTMWADRFELVSRPDVSPLAASPNLRPKPGEKPAVKVVLPTWVGGEAGQLLSSIMETYHAAQREGRTLYLIVPHYTPIFGMNLPGVVFVRPGDPRLES